MSEQAEPKVLEVLMRALSDFGLKTPHMKAISFDKEVEEAAFQLLLELRQMGYGLIGAELADVAKGLAVFGNRAVTKADAEPMLIPEYVAGMQKAFAEAGGYIVGERL